ncbi:MAG: AAA family ATPase [Alphaproteobacteria bacterium]|nr:AAA family ATPase [Alphaproteobacteria bacterium]
MATSPDTFVLFSYEGINFQGLESRVKEVARRLVAGLWKELDVRNLSPTSYYKARVNNAHDLLFKVVKVGTTEIQGLLLCDVLSYKKETPSRFLHGLLIEREVSLIAPPETPSTETLFVPNSLQRSLSENAVHHLDRFLVFDDTQTAILGCALPLILIGSAGSGKTSLTLEKLKILSGDLLYVTLSSYLVHNARRLYYAAHYENKDQLVDFLSFQEFLETIRIPEGREITADLFLSWLERQGRPSFLKDGRKVYEEFRGVLTGSHSDVPYLEETQYMNLGVRESIYPQSERKAVYPLFMKYVQFLKENKLFDSSILSYRYASQVTPRYDAVIVDEVQDFTNSQLALILKTLKDPSQFLLCGDANQIVHPNFFSWGKLKSQFYKDSSSERSSQHSINERVTQILVRNYRNTPEVTELANRVLKIKNARFGSVDKESHSLIESQTSHQGHVSHVLSESALLKELNEKIRRSTRYALVVLEENQKEEAKKYFDTPLIFSVQEAKGLEYENVILYHFMANESHYADIAKGLDDSIFEKDFVYGRHKDKTDKSLEAYKFYINALYVAITRATHNVYVVEPQKNHPLLSLLKIHEIAGALAFKVKESSLEEWQKEASRLASQGKLEQAQAIEKTILKKKPTPWVPLDEVMREDFIRRSFETKTASKQDKILLLEYAMAYGDLILVNLLQREGLKAAQSLQKSRAIMAEKYFGAYQSKNTKSVLDQVAQYGLEHRSPLNFTPLMSAIYAENDGLVRELMSLGANCEARDTIGRTALQIALYKARRDSKYSVNKLGTVYESLQLDSLSLDSEEKLIKIDASRAEYFLINILMLFQNELLSNNSFIDYDFNRRIGFTSGKLKDLLAFYPDALWPAFRKKQTYISHLLSRNEVGSSYTPNRKLFTRTERGYYIVNPDLKIKIGDDWLDLTSFLKTPHEKENIMKSVA